ncbi:MAG: aminopeptidase, partial [Candidatus Heimdallarchaeota archaeon]
FENLKKENLMFYEDILPKNYDKSYSNPTVCVKTFGDDFGQLMSYFYSRFRAYTSFAFTHRAYKLEEHNRLFIEVFDHVKNNDIKYESLKKIVIQLNYQNRTRDYINRYRTENNPDYRFYTNIIMNDDLTDLRYLFKYGSYISENETNMAKFMSNFPQTKIITLAKALVKAYIRGIKRAGKIIGKRKTVGLLFRIGMEKLYREVIHEFERNKFKVSIFRVQSTNANRQYNFDHKYDDALIINQEWLDIVLDGFMKGVEETKDLHQTMSGVALIMNFGEKPFSPENKPELLRLSENQTKLYQELSNKANLALQEYQPSTETSFTIIAFPSTDIGEEFEEIFDATIEVNMVDTDKYEAIQQKIIDKLDQADTVHIKGKNTNETDLVIQLQELKKPDLETNFVNSGSAVNIPGAEVFTSPQLKGTNGILHVTETYQNGLLYKNLKITFKDGYVSEYSCDNFDTEDENNKYIEQNLLFPHKTLPMGEFAIGTNTLAYVYSRKYDILDVLPILISEKTGPHFALGDTCFARGEDAKRYNFYNKKQVMACDNEKSILRKSDKPQEAYTNVHSDIVMPFDDIEFITATKKNGEKIEVIKEGLFVLPGSEELNEPLLEFRKEK